MSNKYSANYDGSKAELASNIDFSGNSKTRTRTFYVIICLAVLFVITTIVFIALYAHQKAKNDDNEAAPIKGSVGPTTPTVAASTNGNGGPTTPTATPANAVCLTVDCIIAAAGMLKKMNLSADPCDDFNEYACGRFLKETVIPDGSIDVSSFGTVEDANLQIMREIITEDIKDYDPQYLINMKKFFQSCTNEDEIEHIKYEPYFADPLSRDWPTISTTTWSEEHFTLSDVIARYEHVNVEGLFAYFVDTDERNSSKMAIYLDQPTLGLSPEFFNKSRDDKDIMAYQNYLAAIAQELGANATVAQKDAKDVVDLEIALSLKFVPKEEMRDSNTMYNPVSLANLTAAYPNLDIPKALRSAFTVVQNLNLSDDDIVINRFPTYISNISLVIEKFSNRTIQNLFGFKFAIARVGELTKRMREIKLAFDKVNKGTTAELPRWRVCVNSVSDAFPDGMGREYVERAFPNASKVYMDEMVDNLKSTFQEMLEENAWMNEATKLQAVAKLLEMRKKIGYPASRFTAEDISEKYKNYVMNVSSFYENRVTKDLQSNIDKILSLGKPIDKDEFGMASYIVNAQYSPNWNDITFPAGILQPPFFSQTFHDSANYGGIGVVIGHEITHGFDDQGSLYDGEGNLRDWWTKSDRENFENKTQCIIDQNNGFYLPEIGLHVNGINTQGESAADNGGVKESFRAYKKLVKVKGEQPVLPGLNLSNEQIFFLAFGQVWCDKITTEALRNRVLLNVHPPAKYRIIGPLQNSEDFASAYKCPQGSYMNPKTKCGVW